MLIFLNFKNNHHQRKLLIILIIIPAIEKCPENVAGFFLALRTLGKGCLTRGKNNAEQQGKKAMFDEEGSKR